MNNLSPPESIVLNGQSYELSEITEFGFEAPFTLPENQNRGNGVLVFGNHRLDVEFRVRRSMDGKSSCTFVNFPISATEKIRHHLKTRNRIGGGLEERSYDELASGIIDDSPAPATAAAEAPEQKSYVKSFALMAMLLTMVGLAVLATVFLRSRSSLSVSNSALVGNSIAINSKVEGAVVEVFVDAGDKVKKGDVLVRLTNPEIMIENKQLAAQLETAQAKYRALEKQKQVFLTKIEFASKKLVLEQEVAQSEYESAKKARDSAKAAYRRLVPYTKNGAVTQLELDEVANQLRAEESNVIAKENLLKQIAFARMAASKNVLIIGDRLDDELGKIQAELDFASAEVNELELLCEIAAKRRDDLEVTAPRDGLVYVTYRQAGEFIKIADELVGLSYTGETWAAGQVTAGQASRVLPGQPVTISVPALRQRLEGTVMAVGHRAMYSRGHYNADFRGATATDVPVKVYIENLPEDVPAGIRLDMAINTGFGIEWLDDALGYELRPIGSRSKKAQPKEMDVPAPKVKLASSSKVEDR